METTLCIHYSEIFNNNYNHPSVLNDFVAVEFTTRRIHNGTTRCVENSRRPGGRLLCDDVYLPNNTGWEELLAWPHSLNSVAFFSKIKPKEEKVVFLFPLKVAYFDFVLHSRFKTKRSLRSDTDRSIDKSTDRQTR